MKAELEPNSKVSFFKPALLRMAIPTSGLPVNVTALIVHPSQAVPDHATAARHHVKRSRGKTRLLQKLRQQQRG